MITDMGPTLRPPVYMNEPLANPDFSALISYLVEASPSLKEKLTRLTDGTSLRCFWGYTMRVQFLKELGLCKQDIPPEFDWFNQCESREHCFMVLDFDSLVVICKPSQGLGTSCLVIQYPDSKITSRTSPTCIQAFSIK